MQKKHVVLYVEGPTDEEFYNQLKEHIKKKIPERKFKVDSIDVICINGIAKFSTKLLAKFKKETLKKHPNEQIVVFLCYDYDVFEYGVHPPINRDQLEADLYRLGASKVIRLVANRTIEDWFMHDEQGILRYLRLKKETKIKGANGLEKIKYLFNCANRVYQKGSKVENFIKHLNMDIICSKICNEISSLCIELGSECLICHQKKEK